MKVALLQMKVTANKEENIRHAGELLAKAAQAGCDIAVLPEMFSCPYSTKYFREYGEEQNGPVQEALSRFAKQNGIYLIGGSIPELEGDKVYNTSYVYDREGRQIAKHRKAHLFDIDVRGGQSFRESDVLSPGEACTVFDTEFGKMGLYICFDIRFQELAWTMSAEGARVLFVPGAFNMTTGPAHWELLFRSRAVDNQIFTVGVAPARDEQAEYVSYGNSMAVDPWGSVIERLGSEEAIGLADLDLNKIDDIRAQLPVLSARRPHLYRQHP